MPSSKFSITVDDKSARNMLKGLPQAFQTIGLASAKSVALYGQQYIRANMPQDTSSSANSIGYITTKVTKTEIIVNIVETYRPHPDKIWKGHGWFDLPWYMFDSPSHALKQNWRSGNIGALRQTIPMLKAKFEGEMNIQIRKNLK